MNSHTSRSFREAFGALPEDVRQRARRAYRLWREDPTLPGLRFKQIGADVSIRIGRLAGLGDGELRQLADAAGMKH